MTLIARPHRDDFASAAVIGAGISGLICAHTLAGRGVRVSVFEKSRGVGGRMATRRMQDHLAFDHGAQYFTVRDPRFGEQVRSWQQAGLVAPWMGLIRVVREGRVDPCETERNRLVCAPAMNTLCRHLAAEIDVRFHCEVALLDAVGSFWRLVDHSAACLGEYDFVVASVPGPQAVRLLGPAPDLASQAARVTMQPCWAVLAAFDERLPTGFDGAFVHQSPLSWVSRNSSKPGRSSSPECWVLHASRGWSEDHLEAADEEVVEDLLQALWEATRLRPVRPVVVEAHRWRYAMAKEPLQAGCLFDDDMGLVACGDWCFGSRVEGAFLSGLAAAESVLQSIAKLRSEDFR